MTKRRCTCANCKAVKYRRTDDVYAMPGSHFLCDPCFDAYITWRDKTTGEIWVDTFLRSSVARKCKSTATRGRLRS